MKCDRPGNSGLSVTKETAISLLRIVSGMLQNINVFCGGPTVLRIKGTHWLS